MGFEFLLIRRLPSSYGVGWVIRELGWAVGCHGLLLDFVGATATTHSSSFVSHRSCAGGWWLISCLPPLAPTPMPSLVFCHSNHSADEEFEVSGPAAKGLGFPLLLVVVLVLEEEIDV
jgi:hypothetical protein